VEESVHALAEAQARASGPDNAPARRELRIGRDSLFGRAHLRPVAEHRPDQHAGRRLVADLIARAGRLGEDGERDSGKQDRPPAAPGNVRDSPQVREVAGTALA
jgi:hypothetical protein